MSSGVAAGFCACEAALMREIGDVRAKAGSMATLSANRTRSFNLIFSMVICGFSNAEFPEFNNGFQTNAPVFKFFIATTGATIAVFRQYFEKRYQKGFCRISYPKQYGILRRESAPGQQLFDTLFSRFRLY